MELRPKQLLAPGAYEVAAAAGSVEHRLGEFTVGRGIDRTAPRWVRPPRAFFPNHALPLPRGRSLCDLRGIEGDCESLSLLSPVWEATWLPATARPEPTRRQRSGALAVITSFPVSTGPKLAAFTPAIARAVAATRWVLAADECRQAALLVGAFPEPCRKIPTEESYLDLYLPLR